MWDVGLTRLKGSSACRVSLGLEGDWGLRLLRVFRA